MTDKSVISEIRQNNFILVDRDFWGQLFEEITFSLYSSVLRVGDCAIDCGVNAGDHTRSMSRLCGNSGKVFSIEAAPRMMAKARGGLLGLSNIEWVEKAAWFESGKEMKFFFYPNEDGLSSLVDRQDRSVSEEISVTTVTLDEIAQRNVSLIKLDIEGAEYHALLGAERIMTNDHPIIVFENGRQVSADRFEYTKEDFFRLFYERGYTVYAISGMPFIPDVWGDVNMPWQFVAIHKASSRAARAMGVMDRYMMLMKTATD